MMHSQKTWDILKSMKFRAFDGTAEERRRVMLVLWYRYLGARKLGIVCVVAKPSIAGGVSPRLSKLVGQVVG
jgi:hypothetical protein